MTNSSSYGSNEWRRLDQKTQKLIEAYQTEPMVPLGRIANELGITVLVSTLPANVSGEIRPAESGSYVIKINRHEARSRQRFTLAHELSHFLLHKDRIGEGISDTVLYRSSLTDSVEAEANRLAADLIMPVPTLKKIIKGKNIHDESVLAALAEQLGVSQIALKIRLGLGN